MTTIAWDGQTLAGDCQCSLFRGQNVKIHRLPSGSLYGGSGEVGALYAVKDWLTAHGEGEKPKCSEHFHAIVIDKYGKVFALEDNLIFMPITDRPFFAVGSGREFAMAAMFLGQTAENAVKIAHEFDTGTGREVDILKLEGVIL